MAIKWSFKLPRIGELPLARRLRALGTLFVVSLSVAVAITLLDFKRAREGSTLATAAGQVRTLSQQIARTAPLALQGDADAFKELRTARDRLALLIQALQVGGDADGIAIPASPDATRPMLDAVVARWDKAAVDAAEVLAQESGLVAQGKAAAALNDNDAARQGLAGEVRAGRRLIEGSPALLDASDALFGVYVREAAGSAANKTVAVAFASIALAALLLLVNGLNADAVRRREEAERQRREAEAAKDATQEAILRLMNEMGDLANGDLTVRATVSEDITGAIADAVNYAIEELSVLVGRINDAAGRVTTATEAARKISAELLAAAERQSQEIRKAGGQALAMADSMSAVSRRATESAQVARQSLEAAGKGARAVENSIAGMNGIRGQIQETSKRIKRLGESSQEIGEIVELISDITEQTNVLALNAAIQAASAGEAGRGFSVVAEEVQRLAERSGDATQQIAAIVKTIQADTHDAIAAMESSTQGVAEGAKLSDATGQALAEISTVSRNLAQLIEEISEDTRRQAAVATQVAAGMQSILRVTEQTTHGTQQTAGSIGELAGLAVELKSSVAGFKV